MKGFEMKVLVKIVQTALFIVPFYLFSCFYIFYDFVNAETEIDSYWNKDELIKIWKEMFSEKIDFYREGLFYCFAYIGPQPYEKLKNIENKELHQGVKRLSQKWFDEYFKRTFRPQAENKKPKKFFLSCDDDKMRSSLLYYNWKLQDYYFEVYESANGILVRVKYYKFPSNNVKISAELIANLIYNVLDLGYSSPIEIKEAFKINGTLYEGNVFTNAKTMDVRYCGNWKVNVIGFISKTDLCFMLYKSTDDRASFAFRFKDIDFFQEVN